MPKYFTMFHYPLNPYPSDRFRLIYWLKLHLLRLFSQLIFWFFLLYTHWFNTFYPFYTRRGDSMVIPSSYLLAINPILGNCSLKFVHRKISINICIQNQISQIDVPWNLQFILKAHFTRSYHKFFFRNYLNCILILFDNNHSNPMNLQNF